MNDQIETIKEERTISLALWKAVLIVVTAMLASAGAGLYGAMVSLNSDHYAVIAITKDLEQIKENYMPINLSLEKWKNNDLQHAEIIKKLDIIQQEIEKL